MKRAYDNIFIFCNMKYTHAFLFNSQPFVYVIVITCYYTIALENGFLLYFFLFFKQNKDENYIYTLCT